MKKLVSALASAALAASVAACGTTVPLAAQQAAQAASGADGLAASGVGGGDQGVGGAGSLSGGNSSVAGGNDARQVPRQGVSSGPTDGPVPTVSALPGPKSAASGGPVRVGVLYLEGADEFAQTLGLSGLSTGDTKAQAAAVIRYLNANGGLAGHRIDPYYYAIDVASGSNNPNQAHQTACASLTQDSKVRYVVTILNFFPVTLPCYAKAGVGILADQSSLGSEAMSKYASYFAAPGDFASDRMIKNLVDALWARGWLTASSKIGSFTYDRPDGAAAVGHLTKALAAHGLRITSDQRVNDSTGAASQASSVAFQYRANNVDRVIPLLVNPIFVMNAASSQSYRPAYALYSSFGPGFLEGTAPKDQLANAAGIGWQPSLDIGAGNKPEPVSSNETLCFKLMKDAGQASTAGTVRGFQLQICTLLFYLNAAAGRLPSLPGDLLAQSRQLIGTSFAPADTFRSDVTRRPDGAAGYRDLSFVASCSCFQYTSPVRTAS